MKAHSKSENELKGLIKQKMAEWKQGGHPHVQSQAQALAVAYSMQRAKGKKK